MKLLIKGGQSEEMMDSHIKSKKDNIGLDTILQDQTSKSKFVNLPPNSMELKDSQCRNFSEETFLMTLRN